MVQKNYTLATTDLEKNRLDRVIIRCRLGGVFGSDYPAIIDTGCKNTLFPYPIAKRYGKKIDKLVQHVKVAGFAGVANGFLVGKCKFGEYTLENILVFSADFIGELSENILLGLNVLNNFDYVVERAVGAFLFRENDLHPGNPKFGRFANYFKPDGSYALLLDAAQNDTVSATPPSMLERENAIQIYSLKSSPPAGGLSGGSHLFTKEK